MRHDRQVYLLDPQVLSPETIAVTFAKTSRSPESFRQIAAGLTEAKSSEFNEKWVVGYGHASVAEHAVLHIACENISRLAVETLESNRLASYTEKSTRYQTWEPDAYYVPVEITDLSLRNLFEQTCRLLFETYQECIAPLTGYFESITPPLEGENKNQRDRKIRTCVIDVCRFLLPAASLANVGMTINARALEHAIGKLLSHPLQEVREIGIEIRQASVQSVPTLLKYADEIPYLRSVSCHFHTIEIQPDNTDQEWCTLVHHHSDAVKRILASAIYREQNIDYAQALNWVHNAPAQDVKSLLDCLLKERDEHTIPARELETANFTFDLLMDQGAYFETKRHRIMTQTAQHLTARHGYAVPLAFQRAGILDKYEKAMESARVAYLSLVEVNPDAASYIVPNGFNRRVLLNLNLRSALHFISLRSAPNAHFSVRRVAQRMAEEITRVHPLLAPFLNPNNEEHSSTIEKDFFYRVS